MKKKKRRGNSFIEEFLDTFLNGGASPIISTLAVIKNWNSPYKWKRRRCIRTASISILVALLYGFLAMTFVFHAVFGLIYLYEHFYTVGTYWEYIHAVVKDILQHIFS